MEVFNPVADIEGSSSILESDGSWPCFYESVVHSVNLSLEDFGSTESPWVAPAVVMSIAMVERESPYIVDFKFHNCDEVNVTNFNHGNVIEELSFEYEDGGYYKDGKTSLPPYIHVKVGTPGYTVALTLKCLKVEVQSKRDIQI
jgi:hypothetical protein